jgi:chromate transporter
MGNVSSLHDSFVHRGWATNGQFVQAMTVGQLSPGPNGLWVVSLGYLMLGPWGSFAALVGIAIPPLLVIGVEKLYSQVQHHPAVEGFLRGMTLAVVGVFVPILFKLLQSSGIDALKLTLVAVAFSLGWFKRIPVAAILALCALAGVVAGAK